MVWSFEYSIMALDQIGVVDVILPFIIIFTIIFATLQKSNILGKDARKYNIILALVMGFTVIIPHVMHWYPPNADVVEIMNRALPNVSLIAVAFVMIMLILGVFGGDMDFAGTNIGAIGVIVSIIAVIIIFLSAADVFHNLPWWLNWTLDPYVKEVVVVILVFGIIIWFITKEDKKVEDKTFRFKDLTNIFKRE